MLLSEYASLLRQFLDGNIPPEIFARTYDKEFLSEKEILHKELFDILEDFWEDIDAYSPLWEPEDICSYRITEETLRTEAVDALQKIMKYLSDHPDSPQ